MIKLTHTSIYPSELAALEAILETGLPFQSSQSVLQEAIDRGDMSRAKEIARLHGYTFTEVF